MKTRKELKDEYKQMTPRMGVFAIRNVKNSKVYVARASNLDLIWKGEQFKLNANGHPNHALQQDWNLYGSDVFAFEILHELKPSDDPATDPRSELLALEQMTIEDLQPFGVRGYNKNA